MCLNEVDRGLSSSGLRCKSYGTVGDCEALWPQEMPTVQQKTGYFRPKLCVHEL